MGQVEGGCESISIKQAIKKKLISAEYLEAWWRSSLWWRGRGEKSGWAGRGCVWVEGWEPRGVLRELCLRAVCVVVKVAGVAWAGMWRAKKGAERRRKCDFESVFCR